MLAWLLRLDTNEAMDIRLGTRLGPYQIDSQLGKGDFSEVYLARDLRLNRRVVLRILASGDPSVERAFREDYTTLALNHPNISAVFEFDETEGVSFIVSEFVEGETLRQRLVRGPLATSEAIDVAVQVAAALSEAHAHGIIHRDIKPGNIMLRRDGMVKVIDFGLVKLSDRGAHDTSTTSVHDTDSGILVGTPAYISPEQGRGEHIDARSDLWSLGTILYESLTGHLPFEGEGIIGTISQILHATPPPLSHYLSRVPVGLQEIVNRALAKNRDERYQSAAELMVDLKRVGTNRFMDSRTRAFSWRLVFGLGIILLAIALLLVMLYFRQPKKQDRETALRFQIGQAADSAQHDLQERFNGIQPLVVKLPDGKSSTGYDANAVIDAVRTEQIKLTQTLPAYELVGLRIYIIEMYPVPRAETLETITNRQGQLIVTKRSRDDAFMNAAAFITRLRTLSEQERLSIDLKITSEPDQATYDMWASGALHRTTTTNNTVDNVWRGLYRYKLTKAGYKPIEDSLNLVDSDGRTLNCHFNRTDEQDGPHPCKLQ